MPDNDPLASTLLAAIDAELENFIEIFRQIRPTSGGAHLGSVEIYGETRFLNGSAGGDHIVYVDFNDRYDLDRRMEIAARQGRRNVIRELEANRHKIGILLADVSGHSMTDALVVAMLHQAFLTGILYELDSSGGVTTRLLENLNARFFNSTSVAKFVTMIYGEISETGSFRFISAGHPPPLVFSAGFDRFVTLCSERLISYYPLGMFPSEGDVDASRNPWALRYKHKYTVNEINLLGADDILFLYTDGLAEHARGDETYVADRLESILRGVKHASAEEIFRTILDDALAFGDPEDDLSLIVIKKG